MKRLIIFSMSILVLSSWAIDAFSMGRTPKPPGQPELGYGSSENYITSDYTLHKFGNVLTGSYCYYYVPGKLKDGDSAPVIIYLHGMMLLAPEIYESHIFHLVKQGYIVIFPQFQQSIVTLMFDMDQYGWLNRAITASNRALDELGSIANRDAIYLFGHSLGGLMSLCWSSEIYTENHAPRPIGIVMANPCVDMSAANTVNIPGMDWLMDLFVDQLDYEIMGAATQCPVILLTGNNDKIAPDWTTKESAYNSLPNTSSRIVYEFFSDDHGKPELMADHMASLNDDGWMPSWMMKFLGGDAEIDAVDYRYYWAALDAVLAGQSSLDFEMGKWSDGVPVNDVIKIKP